VCFISEGTCSGFLMEVYSGLVVGACGYFMGVWWNISEAVVA
jgi:hypothetical protein